MYKYPETPYVAAIGSMIVVGGLAWWLKSLQSTWSIGSFLILCGSIIVACVAIGFLLDMRDAARRAREQSYRASVGLHNQSDLSD